MKIVRKLKYPITIFLIIVLVCSILILKKKLKETEFDNVVIEEDLLVKEEIKEENKEIKMCSIDIKGAVNNPGVYQIDCNSNVNDAINKANGLTDKADTSVINLAKKVSDEMVIIIYTKEEVKNSNIVDTVIKVVEQECICPNIENDGCINDEITDEIGGSNLININTADENILQELPGIGASKAKAIIKYREDFGEFKSIEDILNVEGIGETLYEQIKIHITT